MSEGDDIRTQVRRISANPHDARTSVAGMRNALIQLLKDVLRLERRVTALEHHGKPR
jgi:hypothetical protein